MFLRARRRWFAIAGLAGFIACSSPAAPEHLGIDHSPDTAPSGFCRSTSCPEPPGGYPTTTDGLCEPAGWSESSFCANLHDSNAPLWWRTSCVGYDLNQSASRHVSYDAFATAARGAFDAWITARCVAADGTSGRAGIDARDRGPVACDAHGYTSDGGNQNVIVFHDDVWPYEAADRAKSPTHTPLTIALTRVSFDGQSGEIYDADIEINSADFVVVPEDPGTPHIAGAYDLQSVLTHEVGHFLGLAHSPLADSVMNPNGDSVAGAAKRVLASEDVRGICAIYPPDGTRAVSRIVDPSGHVAAGACDPTPRHGFSTTCVAIP